VGPAILRGKAGRFGLKLIKSILEPCHQTKIPKFQVAGDTNN
jgi:hypothetical protein